MIHSGTFYSKSASWVVPGLTDLTALFSTLAGGLSASPTAHRLEVTMASRRTETLVRLCAKAHPWRGAGLKPMFLSYLEMLH